MFGPKPVNLSESLVVALEAVKQSLQMLHGYEISFAGDIQIKPQAIRGYKSGNKYRYVEIIGRYRQLCEDNSIYFSATVELKNCSTNWLPDRIFHLSIREQENGIETYLVEWRENDTHTVCIIPESNTAIHRCGGLYRRIGNGIYDRHIEPLYPTATK